MSVARRLVLVTVTAMAVLALAGAAQAAGALTLGDRGDEVRYLNQRLAALTYLPRSAVSSKFGDATFHAVIAFQKQRGIKPSGVAGRRTLRELGFAAMPRPKAFGAGKRIEVSLGRQLAFLVRGNRVVRTIAVSTARPGWVTPRGQFKIYRKERMSWSHPFSVWLPWASYFTGGIAFHAYPEVPVYPASHGCIRVPIPFAQELYAFATYGTPVVVR
jgi:peptidoglycan hydrolase-like protein with peptidoglycan-binding domain